MCHRKHARENVREYARRRGNANPRRKDTCLCSRCNAHARYNLKTYRKDGCIRSNIHSHNMFDILLLNIHLSIASTSARCRIHHSIRCNNYIVLCFRHTCRGRCMLSSSRMARCIRSSTGPLRMVCTQLPKIHLGILFQKFWVAAQRSLRDPTLLPAEIGPYGAHLFDTYA